MSQQWYKGECILAESPVLSIRLPENPTRTTIQLIDMVQISSTFFVLASLVVFGLAVPQYAKRTVGAIEADITAISAQLKSLNTAANNFPSTGGTIGQAIV